MRGIHWTVAALLALGVPATAQGQDPLPPPPPTEETAPAPPAAAPAQEDDPDTDVNFAQPDFTLAALPTTLRLPRHKSSFRVTHRFTTSLGAGDAGDVLGRLFGLDGSSLIGLEYRFGLRRGTQIGLHRTSSRIIQFFAQQELAAQSDSVPLGIALQLFAEGRDNFTEEYSPGLGVILSREFSDRGAIYVEPIYVHNTDLDPDDNEGTVLVGLGTRVRVGSTVYLVLEGTPRVSGFDPFLSQVSFGIEKRMGGHLFQFNIGNGFGTTFSQLARGTPTDSREDWYIGFNISRKFF